jgi:predicted PurR-regulated permease PerM
LLPKGQRRNVLDAGVKGWKTLISFVKSQVMVAGVDAVGIGLGALLLQVPLAIPIADGVLAALDRGVEGDFFLFHGVGS